MEIVLPNENKFSLWAQNKCHNILLPIVYSSNDNKTKKNTLSTDVMAQAYSQDENTSVVHVLQKRNEGYL